MIIVRDIFRIDPVQMKKAKVLAGQHRELLQKLGYPVRRIATDLVSEYYTLEMESEFDSLSQFEEAYQAVTANEEWQNLYPQIRELIRGGRREILTVVE